MIATFIRRRVLSKSSTIIKRVVLPVILVIFLMQALNGRHQAEESSPVSNMIVPGEAIDPIIERTIGQQKITGRLKDPIVPQPSPVQLEQAQLHQPPPPSKSSISADKSNDKGDRNSKNKGKSEKKKDSNMKDAKDVKIPPSPWSMATANITDSHKVRYKGHAITNQTVTLTLMSSADKVFMSLNKREIYRNLQDRGIHLVVLNQYTGKVMTKRVFDTFAIGTEEEMAEFIDNIQDGRILVFAVLDECSTGLTWRGRNKLRELGSRWADKIAYRDMWALVTRKGGLKIAETFSNVATADTGYEWGGPVFLRSDFDLEENPKECDWPSNERNDARSVFCRNYEGYGAMCDCDVREWDDVFFNADDELHKQLSQKPLYKDLAVAILATNRSHYLFKTLKSLWEAPGFNKERVIVYADKPNREINGIAKLYGIPLVISKELGNTTVQHIRHKIQRIFRDMVGAKFAKETVPAGGLPEDTMPPFVCDHLLLLEDDLQVSIDSFKYFHSLVPILERDPSVLGISAFNFFGYREVSSSLTSFYRTAEVNNLAILLSSRVIHEHIAPNWVSVDSKRDWYKAVSVAVKTVQNGAIIYPEVPRARHFGYRGHMISGGVQHNLFRDHILAITTDYEISINDVLKLEATQYEINLLETLKKSDKTSFDFCKHDLLYDETPLIMFVSYNGPENNTSAWGHVMKCLQTWSLYPEAGWKGVWQFHYHGHILSIVGTPFSPFSHLKPEDYKPVTAPPTTTTTTTTTGKSTTTTPKPSPSSSGIESSKIKDDNGPTS
ncbi:LOW QUALITY PROTEIN: protein O-linked-mannose beta-1,2-N-acetylglucosaminyltransferase 1-like [Palaemon carinicauda]|uniref:LOW QUALITY PROTEIN: protein O-linked-mannose beta-1,2-N-acetylglucosaminyltransferase 1-like n=1 Tax=Palaemon carinicauda TaxID=392227 RepID=UPI0035B6A606